jgi:hypothetical protein
LGQFPLGSLDSHALDLGDDWSVELLAELALHGPQPDVYGASHVFGSELMSLTVSLDHSRPLVAASTGPRHAPRKPSCTAVGV